MNYQGKNNRASSFSAKLATMGGKQIDDQLFFMANGNDRKAHIKRYRQDQTKNLFFWEFLIDQ
jgi:predicted lysophospholipase L1 biosynthesis ABC-type transport system permease subunit